MPSIIITRRTRAKRGCSPLTCPRSPSSSSRNITPRVCYLSYHEVTRRDAEPGAEKACEIVRVTVTDLARRLGDAVLSRQQKVASTEHTLFEPVFGRRPAEQLCEQPPEMRLAHVAERRELGYTVVFGIALVEKPLCRKKFIVFVAVAVGAVGVGEVEVEQPVDYRLREHAVAAVLAEPDRQ